MAGKDAGNQMTNKRNNSTRAFEFVITEFGSIFYVIQLLLVLVRHVSTHRHGIML